MMLIQTERISPMLSEDQEVMTDVISLSHCHHEQQHALTGISTIRMPLSKPADERQPRIVSRRRASFPPSSTGMQSSSSSATTKGIQRRKRCRTSCHKVRSIHFLQAIDEEKEEHSFIFNSSFSSYTDPFDNDSIELHPQHPLKPIRVSLTREWKEQKDTAPKIPVRKGSDI